MRSAHPVHPYTNIESTTMIILLVTWFYYNQPPQSTHTAFKTEQACEVARQQILNDANRLEANRQAQIQQDAQRGV